MLERLGAAPGATPAGRHASLSEIWCGSQSASTENSGSITGTSGGKVYVGGIHAAQNHETLRLCNVTHVVNCMNRCGLNQQPGIEYYNFPIERWRQLIDEQPLTELVSSVKDESRFQAQRMPASGEAVAAFFSGPLKFIRDTVDGGGNVLVHCWAGAHRAGTTGVAWLMHAERLSTRQALEVAQRCRPVIDPKAYPELFSLLLKLQAHDVNSLSAPAATTTEHDQVAST